MFSPSIPVVVVGRLDRPTRALLRALALYGIVTRRGSPGHTPASRGPSVTVIVHEESRAERFGRRPLLVCETGASSHVERGSTDPRQSAARVLELARWIEDGAPSHDAAVGSE